MIPIQNRAEKRVIDALLADPFIQKEYTRNRVFQGFVIPNALASFSEYVYVDRVSTVSLDSNYVDGMLGASLRRARLQIDVCDLNYGDMVLRSEKICDILRREFPSCLDNVTYGVQPMGQKVWNVASIDILINEEEEKHDGR